MTSTDRGRFSAREALGLAGASAAFTLLTHGFRLVDQYFVQFVSVPAQAAVGTSIFVLILFHALTEVVSAGTAPWVARATGAGDWAARRRRIGNGVACAVVLSVAVMVGAGGFAEEVAGLLGVRGQTARELAAYLRVLGLGCLPLTLAPLIDQCFIAMGRARVPALLHGLSFVLNAVLTPWFVLGLGWGAAGAAAASVVARAVASGLGGLELARSVGLSARDVRIDAGPMLQVGLPISLASAMYGLVYWGLLRFAISPLGPAVNAALGIGFSALEGVTWPLFHGIGLALASAVGRSLGAGREDLAWSAIRRMLPLSVGAGLIAWAAFAGAGPALTGIFSSDPEVHGQAIVYARVLAWSQLFVAVESLAEGVLFGSGHTVWMLRISAPLNVLRVPLAAWMAHGLGWGPEGVWWAINLSTMAKASLHWMVVVSGSWTQDLRTGKGSTRQSGSGSPEAGAPR